MIDKVLNKVEQLEGQAVELMKALIPIKALGPDNGGDGEQQKADFLVSYLKKIGFEKIENYPAPDNRVSSGQRPNIVAILPGENSEKTVWILAHMDVVPEGDRSKWDSDPFTPLVKDGKIYGRGSEDNNQGLVSGVIAARAFIESGVKPRYNLALMLVSDEETGSEYGLQYVVENHRSLFSVNDLIIVPDAGEPDGSMIEVAEKSILWVKIKTIGKQVHASMPDRGINAYKAAANLTVRLERLYDLFNKKDPVFDPPISTFEPTKKEANVPNVNTIPGDDVFYLDCRILPDYPIEQVMAAIRNIADEVEKEFNVTVELSTEQKEQAAPATPVDAPVVRALQNAVKKVYGIDAKPLGIGGGTVAAIFRRAGFPAAVWSTLDDLAHQPNEYCKISNMMKDAKVFVHVCMAE